jgi:predicted nucleic acid-binding protein
MRLVDTSAWIEWLMDSPTGITVAPQIPSRDEWLVPTIVQLELVKWLVRERGEDMADRILAFTQTCQVTALDTKTAVMAAEFCRQHKLPTADAVIYATARDHGVDLVTCDAHFEGLPGVIYISKVGATAAPSSP